MVFRTHVIHVQGAGGMLERTVRTNRNDREMSARDLIQQRDSIATQYRLALAGHKDRLHQFGIAGAAAAALDPGSQPWWARIGGLVAGLANREDPLDKLAREKPVLGTELALWKMERDGLRRRIAGLSVEIQKKFSLPIACVVFVLIGAPLGMRVRRAGPAVAFVSIAFFLFYYLCLVGGEELANRLLLPPWLAMWLPNLVLGGWGIAATLRATELTAAWNARRGSGRAGLALAGRPGTVGGA
jgi:lipopolysaccharide export system permease protein